MMKKKHSTVIIIVLTCLATLCVAAAIHYMQYRMFFRSGIHVMGKSAYINLQKKCYFIDPNTKEISGESTFTASGVLPGCNKLFSGLLALDAYPITGKDAFVGGYDGFIDGKKITLFGGGISTMSNAEEKNYYHIDILLTDPQIIVIFYFEDDEPVVFAVCADSEEEAVANLDFYHKNKH